MRKNAIDCEKVKKKLNDDHQFNIRCKVLYLYYTSFASISYSLIAVLFQDQGVNDF